MFLNNCSSNESLLSLCLTEISLCYILYHLRTVQLHRNCLTVRRTVYQCDKYGRLLTINDDAQFNVSFRSSMTHTNCWLYLTYYQTWHLSYQQTVNLQLSGTQISDVHTLGLCLSHPFSWYKNADFSFKLRPSYTLHPLNTKFYGFHILFARFGEEKNFFPTALNLEPIHEFIDRLNDKFFYSCPARTQIFSSVK